MTSDINLPPYLWTKIALSASCAHIPQITQVAYTNTIQFLAERELQNASSAYLKESLLWNRLERR
jgi:hypothetical protein